MVCPGTTRIIFPASSSSRNLGARIQRESVGVQTHSRLAQGLLIIAFSLGSCTPSPGVTVTVTPATETPGSRGETPVATPQPAPTLVPGTPFSDDQARELMDTLIGPDSLQAKTAVEQIVAANDTRFIPVFLELMRASQIGIAGRALYTTSVEALEALSGQAFGADWFAWIEWYGATGLEPPPGFTGWKGRLLARIDPGFGEFLRDDVPARLRVEEIQWGGVLVDGIPALDNPKMIPTDQADYLEPGEPVFGLSFNGDSRAYPLRILDWHEMANDVVGGVPVSLAYCTLCGAGIAFDGRASDGNTYTFGSSGFLFRSTKLMYDRQMRTLWNQLTGEPVLGELADDDVKLTVLPIVLTSWSDWKEQHPDTVVLDLDTGHQRPYAPGAAYGDYFSSPDTMFPVWQRSRLLPAKARIFALNLDDVPKAYPLDALAEEQVVNDTVGQTSVVVVARRGVVTVDGLSRRVGQVTYEAGGEVRAYSRGAHTFRPGPDAETVLDESSEKWRVTEDALIGPNDEQAPRLGGHLAYWFGWYAFFPQTLVYGQP